EEGAARGERGPGGRRALVEVGGERDHLRRHARLQREVVAEGELVAHAGREGRLVVHQDLDLGEVRAGGVHGGLREDLVHVRRLRRGEAGDGGAADLFHQAGQGRGEAGVVV